MKELLTDAILIYDALGALAVVVLTIGCVRGIRAEPGGRSDGIFQKIAGNC